MREIKFRAKHHKSNEWFNSPKDWTLSKFFELLERHILHPETLSQYIGLKDKNGKEIYEGDIFSSNDQDYNESVVFDKGCFKSDWNMHCMNDFVDSNEEIVVIGNIYENPDLIKEEKL